MKKLLIFGIVATSSWVAPALAADMAVKAPAAPTVATYNWTGWYVGANIGYGWGSNTGAGYTAFTDPGVGGVAGFFAAGGNVLPGVSPKGVVGGGQFGYDLQLSPLWVLGFVADIQGSGMKASATAVAPTIGNFAGITESNSAQLKWFGTVRGKLGFAANNLLVYGTGGLAYGQVSANTSLGDPSFGGGPISFAGSSSSTRAGWAAGGGLEYALSRNWEVGAEYLYVDLGSISVTETQASGPATGDTFTSSAKFRDNIARAFVNYKFP